MKKRILLLLVSFFAMTAMWASLIDAYKIEVKANANGKAGATAELILTMKNREAIGHWSGTIVLPEGVTFKGVALSGSRYPEGYEAELTYTEANGGTVVMIDCVGAEGVALTGTEGEIATITVEIASDVEPGDYKVIAKDSALEELDGTIHDNANEQEFTWTIEEGEEPGIDGDLTGDGKVDIADAVTVLNIMAAGGYDAKADLNADQKVDVADFVEMLNKMAAAQ
jgi:biopolymer transport protein ExbD